MSVVAQTTCLFSTTIRENIVYGLPQEVREAITDEDIESALKQANAWGFVNDFPRKLETYAGERGVKLSGGQKQRLAIARAIIRKPLIVLLDEATSALDSKAEVVVQEALDKMVEEQTDGCCIIIAHRLSTLRMCSRIIVMDKGSIKESGTHDELMSIDIKKDANGSMLHGWYRDLYETQHGKGEGKQDVEKLNREVFELQEELAKLSNYNQLLIGETKENLKLGKAKRLDRIPMGCPWSGSKLRIAGDLQGVNSCIIKDDTLPRLVLGRAVSTPA
jgi:ABC-type methionine transport system ATPase subunit